ncbi:hypothetical protein WSK_0066 [Novosphingobium sp. Rr 2-17]|uniref:hypothetical protein n=1 Tax=Novosphingobium sp. Rr 2-17 TaxID=555793 RepID=UPI000269AAC1|nr:hypothetical protein [Novosphingobium sp. Rr 2-17]EIZ81359.1 hypothetical protein WSK_0066 [Novosphingobium sp. Rr 2-17]
MTEKPTGTAYALATARHVSSDGCQLVFERDDVRRGQRFAFALDGAEPVSGAVRWVVGDRAGFAFDSPIGHDKIRALEQGNRRPGALDLYLIRGQERSGA